MTGAEESGVYWAKGVGHALIPNAAAGVEIGLGEEAPKLLDGKAGDSQVGIEALGCLSNNF
ncbi:MAG: hypothetical protein PQJ46_02350 [Spirochaetales bacterium]|nr:hypothetical protein [Spirochaetales bacterium]